MGAASLVLPASGAGLARPVAAQATTYLVMELLPGGDIFEQVIRRFGRANDETDESGYTEGDACDIMRMALSAVRHPHDQTKPKPEPSHKP